MTRNNLVALTFEPLDVGDYHAATDTLTLDVDCPTLGRAYRVEWRESAEAEHERLAVVCHWGEDCVEVTHDLHPAEVRELYRYLDSSDWLAATLAGRREMEEP